MGAAINNHRHSAQTLQSSTFARSPIFESSMAEVMDVSGSVNPMHQPLTMDVSTISDPCAVTYSTLCTIRVFEYSA